MSYFRNVENDGAWSPGGTYTFEVYIYTVVNEYGSCSDPIYGPGWLLDPHYELCYGVSYSEPVFDNNDEDLLGDVNVSYSIVELEDHWWKVTVTIPGDLPDGTYYLKHKSGAECMIIS